MYDERIVITGLGAVTPLGNDVVSTWDGLVGGVSAADYIKSFDASKFKTHFACEVKNFEIGNLLATKEIHKVDPFVQYALFACNEAINDASLDLNKENVQRIGVIWGSGMGGLQSFEEGCSDFAIGDGAPRYNPFFIPKSLISMSAGYISIYFGLRGPGYAVTSACSSSSHAICSAFDMLRLNKADVVLTGGSDADITYAGIGGFNALRAISTRNDSPKTASRPFSASRDGFVVGEGGICLILERLDHALARNARIYAEMIGTAETSDAYHITQPNPSGEGAARVMRLALENANIDKNQIDYINAHGTSTKIGDVIELKAIQKLFEEKAYDINISSTKSMTGHLLGAAGALEALVCTKSVYHDIIPPPINHQANDNDPDIDYGLNLTFDKAQNRVVNYAMSNTYGFGGHNACLVFKKWNPTHNKQL